MGATAKHPIMGALAERPMKRAKSSHFNSQIPASPAKQIPWASVFKNHISTVEGHKRMLELLQRHTAAGTDSYKTITHMVESAHEMLNVAVDIAKSYLPSSTSNSPIESKADAKLHVRKTRRISDGAGDEEEHMRRKRQRRSSGEHSSRKSSRSLDPPTPMECDSDFVEVKRGKKRSRSSTGSVEATKTKKRSKNEPVQPVVETDDIMAEVEARLKAKEERRKKRRISDEYGESKTDNKEQRRKRRSSGLGSGTDDGEERRKRKSINSTV